MAATEPFRKEHAHLLEHVEQLRELAATLPGASPTERTDGIAEAVGFLRDRLIPHADAEERILYPAVAEILGSPAATATMISDHRAIVERIDALESAQAMTSSRCRNCSTVSTRCSSSTSGKRRMTTCRCSRSARMPKSRRSCREWSATPTRAAADPPMRWKTCRSREMTSPRPR